MDHRFQRKKESNRWWRREMACRYLRPAACDLVSMGRARRPGNDQFAERINFSSEVLDNSYFGNSLIQENSFAFEFIRSTPKTAAGMPMKVSTGEENLKEKETRHPSQSVIARLMGLDNLPPPQEAHKRQSEKGCYFQKTPSTGLQEKHTFHGDALLGNTDKHQEFKDVFEVMEASEIEKNHKPRTKEMKSSNENINKMSFIRQKMSNTKYFPVDDISDNSKELIEALEVLDSGKDPFVKFHQEPSSLFAKHLHDLKCIPPTAPCDSAKKASKATKHKNCESDPKPERKTTAEKRTHVQKDRVSYIKKSASSLTKHSLREQTGSFSPTLSDSQYEDKAETCLHPTQIVILKPSMAKTQNAHKSIALSSPSGAFGYDDANHGNSQSSGIRKLLVKGQDWKKINHEVVAEYKTKSSSAIAKDITQGVKHNASSNIERIRASRFNKYINGDSKPKLRTSNGFINQHKDHKFSTGYSAELSVNREARRRLSQRWEIAQQFGKIGLADRGSNTLAEMLSLSHRERPKITLETSSIQKTSDEKLGRDGILGEPGSFPVIGKSHLWKETHKLPRPKPSSSSLAYTSTKLSSRCQISPNDLLKLGTNSPIDGDSYGRGRFSCRSSKCGSKFLHSCNSCDIEKNQPAWDPHLYDESCDEGHLSNLLDGKPMLPDEVITYKDQLGNFLAVESKDVRVPLAISEGRSQQHTRIVMLSMDAETGKVPNHMVVEEPYIGHSLVKALPPYCDTLGLGSPVRLKELEHPSPVSILELPSEGENCSSGCFESVGGDLQELRTQLQLLKLESVDIDTEEAEAEAVALNLDNKDPGRECHSPPRLGGILHELKDEEDREFSYLLDVLIDSGVHGANRNGILGTCYSPEYPVCPDIFGKLEKKYKALSGWSTSERRLFFDLINIILAQTLAPCLDLHPWVNPKKRLSPVCARERLVEETWQMVARLRKELSVGQPEDKVLEPAWGDLGDDIDIIARGIESMLKDDLLEELVKDFILG